MTKKQEQPKENGFRDGRPKEEVLNLTDEEKKFVKGVREAKERMRQNEAAFKLLLLTEQGRSSFEELRFSIEDNLIKLEAMSQEILRRESDVMSGATEETNDKGRKLSIDELKINIRQRRKIRNQYLHLLRSDLSGLFQYIDAKGLDMNVYFTEDDYNAVISDAKQRVEAQGLKLY